MGREAQPPHSRLTPRLEADLPRINFYRFCQLLEKRRPGQPLMGGTSHPADDPVRFYPHPGMGFPASELKAVEYDEADDSRPPVIRTTFMGLYGVDSPLPTAYLDDIAQHREGHEALQGLLDIFSHRIMTQFYRIWRKYSWHATAEPGGANRLSPSRYWAWRGWALSPARARHIALPAAHLLELTGVLRQPGKTPAGDPGASHPAGPGGHCVRVSPYSRKASGGDQPAAGVFTAMTTSSWTAIRRWATGKRWMPAASYSLPLPPTISRRRRAGSLTAPLFRGLSHPAAGIPRLAIRAQHHPDRADPATGTMSHR
ncbi:type VI secretion system baseplate subunit TssG [Klebsiella pneumoniae]|nr:type VI secretion system baseplate subunit TssG [Klebsiella pneumoniae]